ncbi:hypothetical protein P692DRAFT_20701349, partial [Suillus brevipes Sb2]
TQHIDGAGISCRQLVSNQRCCVCKKDPYHDPTNIVMAPMPKFRPFGGSVPSKRSASPTFANATKMRTTKQQSKGELALQMRKALESFQHTCSLCAAMGTKNATPHMVNQCPFFGPHSGVEFGEYLDWRRSLQYLKHHKKICFVCHVPQINDDLHPTFGKRDGCEFKDIIAPAAYGVFCNGNARAAAEAHFRQQWSSAEGFAAWLMGKPENGSQSNLMDLFMWY